MKALIIFSVFFLVIQSVGYTAETHGVNCVKQMRGMGLKAVDAYQGCSVELKVHACIVGKQKENLKHLSGQELAEAGKKAIEECQSK